MLGLFIAPVVRHAQLNCYGEGDDSETLRGGLPKTLGHRDKSGVPWYREGQTNTKNIQSGGFNSSGSFSVTPGQWMQATIHHVSPAVRGSRKPMSPRQRTNARLWGSTLFPDLVAIGFGGVDSPSSILNPIYSMSQEKVAEILALEEERGQSQKP